MRRFTKLLQIVITPSVLSSSCFFLIGSTNESKLVSMISLELEHKIEHRLSDLQQETGFDKIDLIREAIVDYLEDTEDVAEASERLKDPGKIWSLGELEQGNDLASCL